MKSYRNRSNYLDSIDTSVVFNSYGEEVPLRYEWQDKDTIVTVPDQTMSLKEIFERFAQGDQAVMELRQEVDHGLLQTDITKLDRMELMELATNMGQMIREAKESQLVLPVGTQEKRKKAKRAHKIGSQIDLEDAIDEAKKDPG